MWLYFLGCFDMDEWMRAARAAAPHLAHTLMLLLYALCISAVRLERDNLHTAETSRVRGLKTQKSIKCQLTRKTDMTLTVPGPTVTLGPTAPEPSRSYRA